MAALSLSDRAFDAVEACGFKYDAAKLYLQQRAANYTAVEHVVCAAYVSAVVGVLEAWLSYTAGAADASDGILAVSIMAVAEILGSVFVLYRWKLTAGVDRAAEKRKEVLTSTVIAGLMVLLGLLLLITSIKDLALHNTAVSVGASLVVSLFGAAASFALYKWKMYYGDQLQSIVVLTDAKCSRCVGCISVSVVLALVLQQSAKLEWQSTLGDAHSSGSTSGNGTAATVAAAVPSSQEPLLNGRNMYNDSHQHAHTITDSHVDNYAIKVYAKAVKNHVMYTEGCKYDNILLYKALNELALCVAVCLLVFTSCVTAELHLQEVLQHTRKAK
eukprot:6707-Heterococcus_DN1.PRE.3